MIGLNFYKQLNTIQYLYIQIIFLTVKESRTKCTKGVLVISSNI